MSMSPSKIFFYCMFFNENITVKSPGSKSEHYNILNNGMFAQSVTSKCIFEKKKFHVKAIYRL